MSAPTLQEILDGLGIDRLEDFKPGVFYNAPLDWLIVLTEDVGYVSEPLIVNEIEILWHPTEKRVVGVKLWGLSQSLRGRMILRRAGIGHLGNPGIHP